MKEKHNISTINSVAPMSLQSQQDFVAHQKTSYPFVPTPPIPRFYKIVLTGHEKIAGDIANAKFNVKLPTPLPPNAVLCVKDFTIMYDIDTLETEKNYVVRMPELLARDSYQSLNNGASDVLCAGYNSYTQQVYAGCAGITINDANFFNNKQITISIDTVATIDDFVLVLYIYAYE